MATERTRAASEAPEAEASEADDPGLRSRHDESGRATGSPYVPAGRDERGRPVASVPHEGFLGRLAATILLVQAVVLAVVAVWGFVVSTTVTADAPTRVLGLGMNDAHAALLAVTAVLTVAAVAKRRWARRYAIAQFLVYLLVFFVGVVLSVNVPDHSGLNLNGPAHFLHATIALLGFVTTMLLSARIVEPPPGPLPYPNGRTDDPDAESDRES